MAEYIEREKLLFSISRNAKFFGTIKDIEQAGLIVRLEPAADVVKVVRCKDCKYYKKGFAGEHSNYCDCHTVTSFEKFFCKPNDFCSYGERKADNG